MDDTAIQAGGRTVRLKWHKLRRAADEPPFAPANLRAGLAAGAAVEIDIRRLGDGAWVCLHDDVLDEETDGTGPVAAIDSAAAARLRIAGADYAPPRLTDLMAIVADTPAVAGHLQLDLKEPEDRLDAAAVASLRAALGEDARRCILSGYHWPTLARVGSAIPGLRLGYDPYEAALANPPQTGADFARFTEAVLAEAPDAAAFYLYHRFVGAALAAGVNPIAILQRHGAFVDVWTLDPTTPDIASILRAVVRAGADQITTNAPGALARLWHACA
ncbi:MAG: glycerophosphodiester phosphodiesterase family protein [Alphaproteobacteria bacterium]